MSKREVGRRVVGTKVLGSANPVARWGRSTKSTCWDSIGGFFAGLLLFFVAFALPTCAARTEKVSNQIKRLSVESPEAVASKSGLALVSGTLDAAGTLTVPKGSSTGHIAAYRYRTADYETKLVTRNETRTEVRGGKDVEITEEVTEEVTDWVEKVNELRYASGWRLGGINLNPERASLDLPWEQTYSEDDGKHRESVEVIKAGGTALLATQLENGQVASQPKLYRLTSKNQEQLVQQMHSSEEAGRWGLLILSVILWTVSLNLIIGPAMILLNIFPIQQIGTMVRGVITFVSFIISCILAATVYVLVKFWWLVALLLIALTIAVVMAAQKRKTEAVEPQGSALL